MRQLWREVGEALLVGRRENPSNQAFGKWLKEHGFVFSDHPVTNRVIRSNAMWLAENWAVVGNPNNDYTNPGDIRKAFDEALEAARPLPFPDLDLEASEVAASEEAADIARAVPGHRKVLPLTPDTVSGVPADPNQRGWG
jgi:hypothetical protein